MIAMCVGMVHAQIALRAELAKPLQAAQEALRGQRYAEAMDRLGEALSVPNRSETETFVIQRIAIPAALGAGDHARAIVALEAVLGADRLNAAERLPMMEALVGASSSAGDAGRLIRWARQYRAEGGANPSIHVALIQALFQREELAAALAEGEQRLTLDAQARRIPEESLLKLLALAHAKRKDDAGYARMLELLVVHYPRREYWADLVARLASRPGFAERLQLDAYRLMRLTGNAQDVDDIMTWAQLALKAGLPAEALVVLDDGYSRKLLGHGVAAAEHDKLRVSARARLAEDDKSLAQQEAAAQRAADGNALAGLAAVYASKAQIDKAVSTYALALERGGLRRMGDVQLRYAQTLLAAGRREPAFQLLDAVQGDDGLADLARLWRIAAR